MLHRYLILFLLCAVGPLFANQRYSNFCQQGGKTVVVNGVSGVPRVQGSYPQCTVTVYLTGTLTLASIFSDNSGTVRANPFTALFDGSFYFYAANGRYDVTIANGGLPAPVTFGDVLLSDPSGGTTVVSSITAGPGITASASTGAVTIGNTWGTVPSGSQTQFVQISPNAGNATTFRLAPLTVTNSADYNFAAQSPTGTLTASVAATATLAPCPLGVSGGHTVALGLPQLLYVAGVGTPEAVSITGGTCTGDGISSGTVIFTPANNHSAGWTIQSNSSGVQEAIYIAGILGAVRMPAGPVQLWANTASVAAVNVPVGYGTSLRGQGPAATFLRTHATTGNWVNYVGNGYADIGDFFIVDDLAILHTTGTMITITNTIGGSIDNIYAQYCYDCMVGTGINGNTHLTRLSLYGAHIGFFVTGSTSNNQVTLSDSTLHGEVNGIRIENTTTVGMYISNNLVDQVNLYGLALATGAAISIRETTNLLPTNEISLTGNDFEAVGTGVEVVGANAAFENNSTVVTGGRINATYCGVCAYSAYNGLKVDGVAITVSNGTAPVTVAIAAIQLQSATNYTIQNNTITAQGLPVAINYTATNNNGGKISGNLIGFQGSAVTLGIVITQADSVQIENNYIKSSGAALTIAAAVTNLAASRNIGVDNVVAVVASAATLAFPANPNITITGSTNVTAVTHPLMGGASGTLMATAATITFTAGTGIGNTFTAPLNVPVFWYWDGTKLWGSVAPPVYNPAGTLQVNSRSVFGNCVLGTSCAVTFVVPWTSSGSYFCAATDQTAAAAVKVVNTSASVATFTGTGTDTIAFVCIGN